MDEHAEHDQGTPPDLALLALRHIEVEGRGDIEATLATFEEDACFELLPCALRITGRERVHRFYEYFFAESRHRVTGYTDHGITRGSHALTSEMTVNIGYPGGSRRDFRTLTIFPYGQHALRGERIYADIELFRVIFGPLLAEAEPIPTTS